MVQQTGVVTGALKATRLQPVHTKKRIVSQSFDMLLTKIHRII